MSSNDPIADPPPIQRPTLDHGTPQPVWMGFRNVYDNLYYLRQILAKVSQSSVTNAGLNQAISDFITGGGSGGGGGGGGGTPSSAFIVSTHALRVTVYSSPIPAIGTGFLETDRDAVYVVSNASGISRWVWAGGNMEALLASRPGDLGTSDVGFLFTATDSKQNTQYAWSGTEWWTIGGYLQDVSDAVTNSITIVEKMRHSSTAHVTTGFGASRNIELADSGANATIAATESVEWTNAATSTSMRRWLQRFLGVMTDAMDLDSTGLTLLNDLFIKSGTAFTGQLTQVNTGNRRYLFPDSSASMVYEVTAGILANNDIIVGGGGAQIKDSLIPLSAIVIPPVCNGRLTLASGFPVYAPQPSTPSSTNTSTEVVTFATAPGWVTGTVLTPFATSGGLTAGTRYYINMLSATTCSFYTTLANALADTSRVDLTASVTSSLVPSGVEGTTLYFSAYNGSSIALYNGSNWIVDTFTEISLALGTLTSAICYDVFCFDSSGTPNLELLAWSTSIARATTVVLQNGIWVKSGDATRRLIGTIYTATTTSTIDDAGGIVTNVGAKRYVVNVQNQIALPMRVIDTTNSWTSTTGAFNQANSNAGNQIDMVISVFGPMLEAHCANISKNSTTGTRMVTGIGIDATTVNSANITAACAANVANQEMNTHAVYRAQMAVGRHTAVWEVFSAAVGTTTWLGDDNSVYQSGLAGSIFG